MSKTNDKYFMDIAEKVSTKSKCLSRKIGAVLVKDNHLFSTGYNGPAAGVPHCEWRNDDGSYMKNINTKQLFGEDMIGSKPVFICPRQRMNFKSGEGMQFCPAVHAEANTICQASSLGFSTKGSTLYCFCPTPCPNCAKEIINAGIVRVVCTKDKEYYQSGGLSSKQMFQQAGVKLEFME